MNLVEDDPKTIGRLMQFFYTSDYDCSSIDVVQAPLWPQNPVKRRRISDSAALPKNPTSKLLAAEPTNEATGKYWVKISSIPGKTTLHELKNQLPVSADEIEECHVDEVWLTSVFIVTKTEESARKIVQSMDGFYVSTKTDFKFQRLTNISNLDPRLTSFSRMWTTSTTNKVLNLPRSIANSYHGLYYRR